MKPEGIAVASMPAADAALREDYARCASITRRSSSNFYYAFMLLPAERRYALYSVYAFCRFVDDIADDDAGGEAKRKPAELLALWRGELDRVYTGAPTHPISRALAHNVRRFAIPRHYFEEIIDGVEMDLGRKRYATFEELRLYCYRVASAVGLVCIEIFGYRNPRTREYAENLGLAFQLTNIIRDLSEDAARGRIYLPLEDLARFGVSEDDILGGADTLELRGLLEYEVERARAFYTLAESALPAEDRAALVCAEAMHSIYRALLERIASKGCGVVGRRHRISTPRKLYLVGRTWAGTRLMTRGQVRDG
ncbi:MAG TPA: presqualene diphosphate synthase HpnD [Candidatus Binataceae bacterium]|nr:presqualene diphosphate synthase HpnD [Candidatus Binataceae bacterium]